MATIPAAISQIGGGVLVEWPSMTTGDVGEWVALSRYKDKTVHAQYSVLASFALQGSDKPDGSNPVTLHDIDNLTAIDHTPLNSKMCVVKENPLLMRPSLPNGAFVSIRILCR